MINPTEKIQYEEITVKIPKPFLNDILDYLNKHPLYEDLNEYVIEALRSHKLEMR